MAHVITMYQTCQNKGKSHFATEKIAMTTDKPKTKF